MSVGTVAALVPRRLHPAPPSPSPSLRKGRGRCEAPHLRSEAHSLEPGMRLWAPWRLRDGVSLPRSPNIVKDLQRRESSRTPQGKTHTLFSLVCVTFPLLSGRRQRWWNCSPPARRSRCSAPRNTPPAASPTHAANHHLSLLLVGGGCSHAGAQRLWGENTIEGEPMDVAIKRCVLYLVVLEAETRSTLVQRVLIITERAKTRDNPHSHRRCHVLLDRDAEDTA